MAASAARKRAFDNSVSASTVLAGEGGAVQEAWPQNLSHTPTYNIGQVVAMLHHEFPATTVTKVRYLEKEGLVKPGRSAAGYRKFSPADVERVRFILIQQRDSFAPLRVIAEQLAVLDAGHGIQNTDAATPGGGAVGQVRSSATARNAGGTEIGGTARSRDIAVEVRVDLRTVSVRDLIELTDSTEAELNEFVKAGLIQPNLDGYFSAKTVTLVQLLREVVAQGIPARNLRPVRTSIERMADIIELSVQSVTGRGRPGEQERARTKTLELGELVGTLAQEMLRLRLSSD